MNTTATQTATIFNIQKFSLHDGPGIRSVVFFKGCPLRCAWCANPESQNGNPEEMWDNTRKTMTTVGTVKTVDEILDEVMKDEMFYEESGGGVTLSGGEVLFHAAFATELLRRLKEKNIHTACETTGFAKPDVFKEFAKHVDLMYFDVKHHDEQMHKEGVGTSLQPILRNLRQAVEMNIELIARIPVIPCYNDSIADMHEFGKLLQDIGVTTLELLPFHQFGEKKYEYLGRKYELHDVEQLHTEDLLEHAKIFENYGINCSVR
jgi:pyruvate formate lyase activating enzyme